MVVKVIVEHNGNTASYEIYSDTEGIYSGRLVDYNGRLEEAPPNIITLVRGVRNWTGSTEIDLLNTIGKAIDEKLQLL